MSSPPSGVVVGTHPGLAPEQQQEGASQDRKPLLDLRPVFVPLQQVQQRLPLLLAFGLWGTFFLGSWTNHALRVSQAGVPGWVVFASVGPILALFLGVAGYFWDRRSYAQSAYRFHPDVLEILEGSRRSVLPLESITGVELERTASQARNSLGTILLTRPIAPAGVGRSWACLRLPDLADAEEVRARINELVVAAKRGKDRRAA